MYSLASRGGLSFTSVRARWKPAVVLREDPPGERSGGHGTSALPLPLNKKEYLFPLL